jgi:hypothetical protein
MFVVVVVVVLPLLSLALVWIARVRAGLAILSSSMLGSLLFGLQHHFLTLGPDHVHVQAPTFWGSIFLVTAYALLVTEAVGGFVGGYYALKSWRIGSVAKA